MHIFVMKVEMFFLSLLLVLFFFNYFLKLNFLNWKSMDWLPFRASLWPVVKNCRFWLCFSGLSDSHDLHNWMEYNTRTENATVAWMSQGWKVIIHLVVNFNIWAAFRLFYRIFVRILHHAPRLSPNGGCTKIEWKNKAFCFIEHEPTRDYSELKNPNYNYCTINTFTWLGNFYL